LATTVLGALSLEVDQMLQGKDPRTLNPTAKGGVRNWVAAMLKGGSLGVYGDFLFSEATQGRQGSPFASARARWAASSKRRSTSRRAT
jgi:hypothetical protein